MRNDLPSFAEHQSEQLSKVLTLVESAAWNLDAALSALNKDSAGYRTANRANPDGGANYVPGELEAASKAAASVLDIFAAHTL